MAWQPAARQCRTVAGSLRGVCDQRGRGRRNQLQALQRAIVKRMLFACEQTIHPRCMSALADPSTEAGSPGAQECGEEAGIPPALAATAAAAGAVSYTAAQPGGVKRDVLFVYDLRLPLDFVPAPQARSLPLLLCVAQAVQ